MVLSEKIRNLRKSRNLTQAQVADALFVSESTVQKWEVGKNNPSITETTRLADFYSIPASSLIDDNIDIPYYREYDEAYVCDLADEFLEIDNSAHRVYDIGLAKNATLHRFLNAAKVPYSAIYIGMKEMFSCERYQEQGMIKCWNGC